MLRGRGIYFLCFASSHIGPARMMMLTGSSFPEPRNKAHPLLGGGGRES